MSIPTRRLVLLPGVHPKLPPFDPHYPPDTPLAVESTRLSVPEVIGGQKDVQLLPFGPVRADVSNRGISFLLYRRMDPALSPATVFQTSRNGKAL